MRVTTTTARLVVLIVEAEAVSLLESPGQVERMAQRLLVMVSDAVRLARRLQTRQWTQDQLEDLKTASALLARAQSLLRRHARRWRHWPLGGEE